MGSGSSMGTSGSALLTNAETGMTIANAMTIAMNTIVLDFIMFLLEPLE